MFAQVIEEGPRLQKFYNEIQKNLIVRIKTYHEC